VQGFKLLGAGFKLLGAGFKLLGAGFKLLGAGLKLLGAGFKLLGYGNRDNLGLVWVLVRTCTPRRRRRRRAPGYQGQSGGVDGGAPAQPL
jgi:hypothetical protein